MTIEEREAEIERDRRAIELAALLLILPKLKTAEKNAKDALALGGDPIQAVRDVIGGKFRQHQPGIGRDLAWALTASWVMGNMRARANHAAAMGGNGMTMDAIRARIAQTSGDDDFVKSLPIYIVGSLEGDRDALQARYEQNLVRGQQQAQNVTESLAQRIAAIREELARTPFDSTTTTREGVELPKPIAAAQDQIGEAFDKSGLSAGRDTVFTIQSVIEANVVGAHEAGQKAAEASPEIGRDLWGYRYRTVEDNRRTLLCRTLHGTTLPQNDPFWLTWRPPNHNGCRSWLDRLYKPAEPAPPIAPERLADFAAIKARFLQQMGGAWD